MRVQAAWLARDTGSCPCLAATRGTMTDSLTSRPESLGPGPCRSGRSGRASGQDLVLQPELVGASMEKRGIGSDGEPSTQEDSDGEGLDGQEIEVAADP